MERATDIYITVQKMRQEVINQLESDDVLYGDPIAYARTEAEGNGLLRVLHMLEDDFDCGYDDAKAELVPPRSSRG